LDPLLRTTLWDDVVTEYDARLLSTYLHSLGHAYSPAFLRVEAAWRRDEERHYGAFARVFRRVFDPAGVQLATVAERIPNFAPIGHLFTDEFAICTLGAYDELVTIRGYGQNLALYARLGPEVVQLVRRVIADEARHYAGFLAVLLDGHRDRLDEVPEVLEGVHAATWTPYGKTFVLDHEDGVYTQSIMDDARRALLRQVRRVANPRRCALSA
jgi:hypothetical protein